MNTRSILLLLLLVSATALSRAQADPEDKIIRVPGTRRVVVVTTEEKLARDAYPGYLALSGPPPVRLYRQPPTPRPRRVSDPAHMAADREQEAKKEKDKAAAAKAEADKAAATATVVGVELAAPAAPAAEPAAAPTPDVLPSQQATDPRDRTDELLSYFQRQKQSAAAAAANAASGAYPGFNNGEPEPGFLQPPPSSLAPIAPAPPSRATYHVE